MDNADRASKELAHELEVALQHREPELGHIGICRNCNEKIGAGVFCDADCRIDYDKRKNMGRTS